MASSTRTISSLLFFRFFLSFIFFFLLLIVCKKGLRLNVLIGQYLNMLRELRPQKWVFDELKGLSTVQFRFKDIERPQSYVCSLASKLQYYPIEEVISGDYTFKEWKPELIESILDILTPDKIRYSFSITICLLFGRFCQFL